MIKPFTTLLVCFLSVGAYAQAPVGGLPPGIPLPASSDCRSLSIQGGRTLGETVLSIGQAFLGKPYVAHTLEVNPTEQLVVNLQQFDCTTYLETVIALSLAWHQSGKGTNPTDRFESLFRRNLTKIRYRNGQIDGYASRLHYFSDWLLDNERKNLVHDISRHLVGSLAVSKSVSYMTTATWKYPHLKDSDTYRQIAQVESAISQQPFYFIPKKSLRQAESHLRDGDIIMLTAARPGLDMKHCGFAMWQNGKVYLLHASSDFGRVMVTKQPLTDYVLWNKRLSGIRVARLNPNVVLGVQTQ